MKRKKLLAVLLSMTMLVLVCIGDGKVFAIDSEVFISLKYGSDSNGQITEWMLKGDVNRDGVVTNSEEIGSDIKALTTLLANGKTDIFNLETESADTDGSDFISGADVTRLNGLFNNKVSLPDQGFNFRVIDTPRIGFGVKEVNIVADGNVVVLTPDNPTNGSYHLEINEDGTATVLGRSLKENDVQFKHINEAPIIIANDKELMLGEEFDPLKDVNVTDKEDGNIILTEENIALNDVDTTKVGNYWVTYTVTDKGGSTTTKEIKITVKENNSTPVTPETETPVTPETETPNDNNNNNQNINSEQLKVVETGDSTQTELYLVGIGVSTLLLLIFMIRNRMNTITKH